MNKGLLTVLLQMKTIIPEEEYVFFVQHEYTLLARLEYTSLTSIFKVKKKELQMRIYKSGTIFRNVCFLFYNL